ncbi:cellulase family glycosylhydrolase [Asticcacaulis sp. AC402]|uniref:glycoside hydrolase 5 family protein n=1 Tax=Asticcacaulis sp. AC402 TaxID=1282361 RepID=UPI0003C3C395|nr:cellulase family glycosylhydrolase [Asticcacaulis sp. AC402]ESQ75154.1 hypothetical protein ABAC402_10825 [Asticcacaulis sp. AC402]
MADFNRRHILCFTGASVLAGCDTSSITRSSKDAVGLSSPSRFVSVDGQRFSLNGSSYRFVGANIWYGAYLGSPGATGDRARLLRELDDMRAVGITNLRVLASSESGPLISSVSPTFSEKGKLASNSDLLSGLDFLLSEMAKRDMKAVLYLTNFWEWSGGMQHYLHWADGRPVVDPAAPDHIWPAVANRVGEFYRTPAATELYYSYVRSLVSRVNSITGIAYKDDPTLMSWQLSNEPRAGGSRNDVLANLQPYYEWIETTVQLIRSIDKNHLVSLGHEGLKGCGEDRQCVLDAHRYVDYMTAHIWPQNWGWVNGKDLKGTYQKGEAAVSDYIDQHVAMAKLANQPLVFEEFGYPRDDEAYDPGTPTIWRDRFYALIFKAVEDSQRLGGPVQGSNLWAWGGTGRAIHSDYKMKKNDVNFVGDPPHEPQGWYSVFSSDTSTKALVKAHASVLSKR